MLLKFQFSNFACYRDLQTISWVASSLKHPDREAIRRNGAPTAVLPVCALYGANASGKSNAVHALRFFIDAINHSYRRWSPEGGIERNRFAGSSLAATAPSRFILDFLIGDIRFEYGFAVNDEEVLEEWLHAYPEERKQSWFRRRTGLPISFGPKLKGQNRAIESLNRKNSLFLSAAAQSNHEQLSEIRAHLIAEILIDRRDTPITFDRLAPLFGHKSELTAVEILQAAEFGVVGARKYIEEIGLQTGPGEIGDFAHYPRVRLVHAIEGQRIELEEALESDGTRTYANRIPMMLKALESGGLLVIDEIDRSLHPSLCLETIKLFLSPESNPKGAQLLFTTHDASLLSSGLLRRDEIWFSEKKPDGASELYPLSDFSPRKNENLERGYLQGRYGGVPMLSEERFLAALGAGDAVE